MVATYTIHPVMKVRGFDNSTFFIFKYCSSNSQAVELKNKARASRIIPCNTTYQLPSFPLIEVVPLEPTRGYGERCKLLQRDPGWSRDRKRIWCTL